MNVGQKGFKSLTSDVAELVKVTREQEARMTAQLTEKLKIVDALEKRLTDQLKLLDDKMKQLDLKFEALVNS